MADANTEVIDKLNELAEQRFIVQLKLDGANRDHKTAVALLESEHEKVLAGYQSQIDGLDAQIWGTIKANRKQLIAAGKQSFAIMKAKFQLRKSEAKTKVKDANGIMNVARRLGVVRQIAKASFVWKFNQSKFFGWLEKNGELRSQFEEFLEDVDAGESLTMQPNSNYTVHHDSKRISPPSVSIKLS